MKMRARMVEMPDRTGIRPQIVAWSVAQKAKGKCDHCREIVPRGQPIAKVWQSCCQRHEPRPSRRSGGAGNWICVACVNATGART